MSDPTIERVLALLREMEAAQANKVIELARRLKPGLTAEDIRNPHDFPDLDDPDWHFEDGQLAGIQAVRFAIQALDRESAEPRATPCTCVANTSTNPARDGEASEGEAAGEDEDRSSR